MSGLAALVEIGIGAEHFTIILKGSGFASSPAGLGVPVISGAIVGLISIRAGELGARPLSSGMKLYSRPEVRGVGVPVPNKSSSVMVATSRPHSTIERRSWLKPELEMPIPIS
jgi:hypothetical protein